LRNKLLFLLPGALLLSAFAPWAVTPILMVGGAYLAFEATEKILEAFTPQAEGEAIEELALSGPELEKQKVDGAIRTDLILSGEIMAIALAEVAHLSLVMQAAALAIVGVLLTIVVYGAVALIVKMDDMGLHLSRREAKGVRSFGRGLVKAMPVTMEALTVIGTAAMLWVGGGIIVHGLEKFHLTPIPHWVEGFKHWAEQAPGVGALTSPLRSAARPVSSRTVPAASAAPGRAAKSVRIAGQDQAGVVAGHGDQVAVRHRVGQAIGREAALLEAQRVAAAAQLQVLLGDLEAVVGAPQDVEALLGGLRQRRIVEQDAGALARAPADAAAQLVQLGQAEALGVLDDHDGGVGHIDPDLDHRGGDQHRDLAIDEVGMTASFSAGGIWPWTRPTPGPMAGQVGGAVLGGAQVDLVGLRDQRADPEGLGAAW
jgi:predicted DNA repair protein MutK